MNFSVVEFGDGVEEVGRQFRWDYPVKKISSMLQTKFSAPPIEALPVARLIGISPKTSSGTSPTEINSAKRTPTHSGFQSERGN